MIGGAFWEMYSQTYKQTIRSKWLIMFTGVFFFFAFNLPLVTLEVIGLLPPNYVSFYIGTLISTSFVLMPLLGLPLGSVSIVEERESGALSYVLSTPISREKFLAARTAGLFSATATIIVLGFGLAALVGFHFSSGSIQLLYVTVAAVILNGVMIGISMIISTLSRKRLTAHSLAILLWFLFTYASDTAESGAALGTASSYHALIPWIFANPVEMSRLIAVMQIPSGVQDIGATGEAMQYVYGIQALNVLYEWMAVWVIISLIAAFIFFRFQDVR